MLAALSSSAIALSLALVPFLVGYLIRHRLPISWLIVRNGRVALSDKGRVKISNREMDVGEIEASIAESFSVDEDGDIVVQRSGPSGQ